VEASGIPLAGLSPGKYGLRLKVMDLDAKSEAVREGSFEKAPPRVSAGGAGSPPITGFEAYYDQIQYVTTPDTVKILKGLTPEGKKKFLEEFWGRHDLSVFLARMKYADEQFSSGFKKGHQTERGRIFLKYGKPDEIVPHPADEQYPSHEIWFYYSHGGKQFVFSDLTGYGRYELVYTNVQGESSNPKWQTLFDGTELNR
jgi:GWxTD domain-containing protein